MTTTTYGRDGYGRPKPTVDHTGDALTPKPLPHLAPAIRIQNRHQVKVVRIKPWGAWQAKCAGCRFESAPYMSRPEAIREHTVHVAKLQQAVAS